MNRWPVTEGYQSVPTGDARETRWAEDGRALFYRGNQGVFRVPVSPQGEVLRFGEPVMVANMGGRGWWPGQQLFGDIWLVDYDVASDGRVIGVGPVQSGQTHLAVVQNWVQEMIRKLDAAQ